VAATFCAVLVVLAAVWLRPPDKIMEMAQTRDEYSVPAPARTPTRPLAQNDFSTLGTRVDKFELTGKEPQLAAGTALNQPAPGKEAALDRQSDVAQKTLRE